MTTSPTETLLSNPGCFDIETLSPLQRAICRVKDGVEMGCDLESHPDVLKAFGGPDAVSELARMARSRIRPSEIYLIAGVRSGKSVLGAASIVEQSQSVDVSGCKPGDMVRIPVFSLTLKASKAVMHHLITTLLLRPILRPLIVGDTKDVTSDKNAISLRHPSGREIVVEKVAMGSAGGGMVSDFHAGDIGDEVPRMVGEADGARNFDDMRLAAIARRLPGAQAIWIGSPWAPFGPIYDTVVECHGHPSPSVVVIRGTGPALNPKWWTPERVAQMQANPKDQQAYQTDVLGEFADPETTLITASELESVTRTLPLELPPQEGWHYVAAIDPATRGNAFTLVVLTCRPDGVRSVVLARQWCGSKVAPLSPDYVFREISSVLRPYRVEVVATDQFSVDANRDLARRHGLHLYERAWNQANKLEKFDGLRLAIADRGVELSPCPVLRADLLSVRRRVTQTGVSIELPHTSDGRHADYAPALAMALGEHGHKPDTHDTVEEEMERSMARRATRGSLDDLAGEYGLQTPDDPTFAWEPEAA
jgi:hypothetical protein